MRQAKVQITVDVVLDVDTDRDVSAIDSSVLNEIVRQVSNVLNDGDLFDFTLPLGHYVYGLAATSAIFVPAGEPEPEPAGSRDRDEWRHEAVEQQRLK